MIDKLKTFVGKHKQEFDTSEPSQELWEKIDARIEVKSVFAISSKWLSKLKYLGLSASILLIVVYFVSQNISNSSSNELAQHKKDSALNNSEEWVKANQNKEAVDKTEKSISNSNAKTNTENKNLSNREERSVNLTNGTNVEMMKDSVKSPGVLEIVKTKPEESNKATITSIPEKKESISAAKNKKTKINLPAEPEKMNSYTGTLYDGYSLCSVVRAYKFPGQVSMDEGGNYTGHRIMKTMSCSRLEDIPNMKAVWLKGKTGKKLTLSIKAGFKNILLVKGDGRKLTPEAISHYYPGLGVISDYTGKFFEMTFKDKVELILFFKDVEEGDKVMIDGVIEAVVKNTL